MVLSNGNATEIPNHLLNCKNQAVTVPDVLHTAFSHSLPFTFKGLFLSDVSIIWYTIVLYITDGCWMCGIQSFFSDNFFFNHYLLIIRCNYHIINMFMAQSYENDIFANEKCHRGPKCNKKEYFWDRPQHWNKHQFRQSIFANWNNDVTDGAAAL